MAASNSKVYPQNEVFEPDNEMPGALTWSATTPSTASIRPIAARENGQIEETPADGDSFFDVEG
jgi:hypothetical protein